MTSRKSVALVCVLMAAAITTAQAEQPATGALSAPAVLQPSKGISLYAGSKHAVGYYLQAANSCALTLMLADITSPEDDLVPTAARVQVTIEPGRTALVDTVDGPSLEVACAAAAKSLQVRSVERVAYVPARK